MWVTDDGVAHTVALPEPRDVLSPRARESWAALRTVVPDRVLVESVQQAYAAVLERPPSPGPHRDDAVGAAPPLGVLDADVSTLDALLAAVEDVEPRWRLDVVVALDDLLDVLPDD